MRYNKSFYIYPAKDKDKKFEPLQKAVIEAKKSSMSKQHGCVIVSSRNFEVISTGHNKHRFHQSSLIEIFKNKKGCTIHAEIDAINNCKNKSLLNGAILFIVRLDKIKKNSLLYSAPCNNCKKVLDKMINKYGLSKVYFSTDMDL